MNRYLISAAAVIVIAAASFSSRADRPDWINYEKYETANRELKNMPDNGKRVVFFGNSITEFWASRRPFFEANGFIGRGISGQTTYQFLSRFRDDVVELHPAVVVINAGTNDVAENTHAYNARRTVGNIKSMVEIARANGIKVILTTTLPSASFGWNKTITDAPEKISALNKELKAYAAQEDIPFVDYFSAVVADDGRAIDPTCSNDGVHPNDEGYSRMEALILPVVKKELE